MNLNKICKIISAAGLMIMETGFINGVTVMGFTCSNSSGQAV